VRSAAAEALSATAVGEPAVAAALLAALKAVLVRSMLLPEGETPADPC
jgi:hypothetical protein